MVIKLRSRSEAPPHPTKNYRSASNGAENQSFISQLRLGSYILSPGIIKSLNIDANDKLRGFKISYTFDTHEYRDAIFFVIVTFIHPYTRTGLSDIITKLNTIKMSQLNQDRNKENI